MKTFQEFISEAKKCWPGYKKKGTQKLFGKSYNRCVEEGKVPWDDQNRPLRSGWTPREKNRAKRVSTGVENPNIKPSGKQLERYGKLKIAHDDQKNVKTRKDQRHKNPEDYSVGRKNAFFKPDRRMPSESKHGNSAGLKRIPRGAPKNLPFEYMDRNRFGAANDEKRDKYYEKGPKGLKEPKESFEFELEESSTGERTRGRATLGRAGNKMDRRERTVAAIAKKAGIKGTGKLSTKDLRAGAKDYTTYDSDDDLDDVGSTEQDHYIRTHSSPRSFATDLMSKSKPAGRNAFGRLKHKIRPSADSVRKVKDLRKSITKVGADKQGQVHIVDIMHRDSSVGKGDRTQQIERGKNFIQALKDTPKHLKKAQIEASKDTPKHLKRKPPRAIKKPLVGGEPTAVMSG